MKFVKWLRGVPLMAQAFGGFLPNSCSAPALATNPDDRSRGHGLLPLPILKSLMLWQNVGLGSVKSSTGAGKTLNEASAATLCHTSIADMRRVRQMVLRSSQNLADWAWATLRVYSNRASDSCGVWIEKFSLVHNRQGSALSTVRIQ